MLFFFNSSCSEVTRAFSFVTLKSSTSCEIICEKYMLSRRSSEVLFLLHLRKFWQFILNFSVNPEEKLTHIFSSTNNKDKPVS